MENNKVTINGVDHSVEDFNDQEKLLLSRIQECRNRVNEAQFSYQREVAALEWISQSFVQAVEERQKQPESNDLITDEPDVGSPAMTVN